MVFLIISFIVILLYNTEYLLYYYAWHMMWYSESV
jgi:hypothetical protein